MMIFENLFPIALWAVVVLIELGVVLSYWASRPNQSAGPYDELYQESQLYLNLMRWLDIRGSVFRVFGSSLMVIAFLLLPSASWLKLVLIGSLLVFNLINEIVFLALSLGLFVMKDDHKWTNLFQFFSIFTAMAYASVGPLLLVISPDIARILSLLFWLVSVYYIYFIDNSNLADKVIGFVAAVLNIILISVMAFVSMSQNVAAIAVLTIAIAISIIYLIQRYDKYAKLKIHDA